MWPKSMQLIVASIAKNTEDNENWRNFKTNVFQDVILISELS